MSKDASKDSPERGNSPEPGRNSPEPGNGFGQLPGKERVVPLESARKKPAEKSGFIEELYHDCWADLCRWLRNRFGAGPPEPEDIAQSAFTRMMAVKDIESIRDPRAFLFTVAAREAVSGYRSRQRMHRYIDEQLQNFGLEAGEISPERVYMAEEQLQAVVQDLKQLTDKQREIVIRARVLGQSYDDISAATGWSTSAISRNMIAAMTVILRKHHSAADTEDQQGVDHDA